MWIADWTARAACKGTDPDELFVQGAAQNRAKLICRGCPVRTECLADALDNRIEFGVWGGMTERQRRAMLKNRPDVSCWATFLTEAAARRAGQSVPAAAPAPARIPAGEPAKAPAPVALPTPLVPVSSRRPADQPTALPEAA